MSLPFRAGAFDVVLLLSALEFVPDPAGAHADAQRVACSDGRVIAVIPRRLWWADRLFEFLAGVNPEADFNGGRERVQVALADVEAPPPERELRPRWLPPAAAPYELVVIDRARQELVAS